jgi:glycosyltransferase involved in cell wall biosynthesis
MKIFIGHPTANQFFRHMTSAFERAGVLGRAATGLNGGPALGLIGNLLPSSLRRELARRSFPEPWGRQLHTRPVLELSRLVLLRLGMKTWCQGETALFGVDAVFHDFDRWMAQGLAGASAIYLYEDGALSSFQRAASLGITRIYDLPIAFWETARRLLEEEASRLPQWAETLGGGIKDSPAKLARKTRELELAEFVITPSQFVADSLPDWAKTSKRVIISPFGSPASLTNAWGDGRFDLESRNLATGRPLRVLFAGSMGQRKGLGDLFTAMRLLKRDDVELVVMGSLQAPIQFYRSEFPDFIYEPGRPHDQVLELMRSCDVFCLPSIVEGRALVMQEAMSQGLPIIITSNTGGADLVREELQSQNDGYPQKASDSGAVLKQTISENLAFQHSQPLHYGRFATGFLVPIRSPEAIADAIAWCADHRPELAEMGLAARLKAATYTWEDYGDRVLAAITKES